MPIWRNALKDAQVRKHFQKGNALVGAISEHLEKKEVKYIDANIVHHHIYMTCPCTVS